MRPRVSSLLNQWLEKEKAWPFPRSDFLSHHCPHQNRAKTNILLSDLQNCQLGRPLFSKSPRLYLTLLEKRRMYVATPEDRGGRARRLECAWEPCSDEQVMVLCLSSLRISHEDPSCAWVLMNKQPSCWVLLMPATTGHELFELEKQFYHCDKSCVSCDSVS